MGLYQFLFNFNKSKKNFRYIRRNYFLHKKFRSTLNFSFDSITKYIAQIFADFLAKNISSIGDTFGLELKINNCIL